MDKTDVNFGQGLSFILSKYHKCSSHILVDT